MLLATAAAAATALAALAAVALTTAAAERADLSGARSARRGLGTRSVCAGVLALRNRRSSLALARMQLELSKARAQSAKLAERDEMSRGKMKGGRARAVRHDDNESAPPIALVVTSVSKKDVEIELDAPVHGPEAGAPFYYF